MVPFFLLGSALLAAVGLGGMAWYNSLSNEQKSAADRMARGFAVEVEHPELGASFTYPGAPYVFEKTPWRISRRAPRLGEHNQEVFGEIGFSTAEIDTLRGPER